MSLEPQLEQILQGAITGAMSGGGGGLEPTLIESTINQIMEASARISAQGNTPVMLVAGNIRAFLSRLIRSRLPTLNVLAYEEVPANKTIKVVEVIGSNPGMLQTA